MAFCCVDDINLTILEYLNDDLLQIVNLCYLDKMNYDFMKKVPIYQEYIIFKNAITQRKKPSWFHRPIDYTDIIHEKWLNHTVFRKICKLDLFHIFKYVLCEKMYDPESICYATKFSAKYNRIRFLNFVKPYIFKQQIDTEEAINEASKFGHINILKWFHKNKCLVFSGSAIMYASLMGHIHVLEWFRIQGYNVETIKDLPIRIPKNEITALDLHLHHRLLNFDAIDGLSLCGYWHELPDTYLEKSIALASFKGHINVLEWFR